jgi:hypothetical protein
MPVELAHRALANGNGLGLLPSAFAPARAVLALACGDRASPPALTRTLHEVARTWLDFLVMMPKTQPARR